MSIFTTACLKCEKNPKLIASEIASWYVFICCIVDIDTTFNCQYQGRYRYGIVMGATPLVIY